MKDGPLRIIYIDTCIGLAGGQFSLLEIVKRIDRERYHPLVCAPRRSRVYEACANLSIDRLSLPFESVHLASRGARPFCARIRDSLDALYGVFYLSWKIRAYHVDIIHANTFKAALVGAIASLLTSTPLVFHDRIHISHGLLGKLVARMSNRIIVVSEAVGSKHDGQARRKLRLIRDGIDTYRLVPSRTPRHTRRVCYLGRISEEKGIHRLVEAAALVVRSIPEARFAIGGSPFTPRDLAYETSLRARIDDLGLTDRFEFPGYIEDVKAFLEDAGVLVLPSKNEPLGMVLLEAMALEKPVIAFDIGGPREIISQGQDGLLVRAGDVRELAEAIVRILTDHELARQMGKAGRQTVLSRFSTQVFVPKVTAVYDEIKAEL